jgi:hypothetical protein
MSVMDYVPVMCTYCGHLKCEDSGGDPSVQPKPVYDIDKQGIFATLEGICKATKLIPELNSLVSEYGEHRHAWVYYRVCDAPELRTYSYNPYIGLFLSVSDTCGKTEDAILSDYRSKIYNYSTRACYQECVESFFDSLNYLVARKYVKRVLSSDV